MKATIDQSDAKRLRDIYRESRLAISNAEKQLDDIQFRNVVNTMEIVAKNGCNTRTFAYKLRDNVVSRLRCEGFEVFYKDTFACVSFKV